MDVLVTIQYAGDIVADPDSFEDFVVDAARDLLDAYENPGPALQQAAADLHLALNGHL